jgi:Fe2+ transport system protein B
MGARNFQFKQRGYSLQEAYHNAVDEAIDEYGNDIYNGSISTTRGVRDVTKEFKASGKSVQQYIDDVMDNISKWDATRAICIEEPKDDVRKIKSKVEHIVTPGTKKWVLKYVVIDLRDNEKVIKSCFTKGEAVEKAREHTEITTHTTVIEMQKVLQKANNIVAKVTYKGNRKQGLWVLFGVAAE